MAVDVAIVGAGPAGASAAIEAARLGLDVAIIDENCDAGGQVWRAASPAILAAPRSPERERGDRLRAALSAARVDARFATRVWHLEREGDRFRLALAGPHDAATLEARALILATGAQERVFPVPGWTTPGVIGLAAATALMKEQGVLPGRRVVVAGVGPLLVYVASEISRHGGTVVALADLNPAGAWLASPAALLSRPDLLARGAGWLAQLATARVPVRRGWGVRRIEGGEAVARVTLGPVDANWAPAAGAEWTVAADAVCLGHGLSPAIEATRQLDAAHVFDPVDGSWRPELDRDGRTSVPRLYACGDGAGILGADAAPWRGIVAARATARDLGRAAEDDPAPRRRLARAARFGAAMAALTAPRPGVLDAITPETIVCRCESLTRAALEAEIADGGVSPGALRAGTRCGMGPCGGRFCAETASMLAARATGRDRAEFGLPTARSPLRPVAIAAFDAGFDYADIPFAAPSPL